MRVSALYRYPIKGMTAEQVDHLRLTDDHRPEGDRVWSLRFPRGVHPQDRQGQDYWPKADGLCLRDQPDLARVRLSVDPGPGAEKVHLTFPGRVERTYRLPSQKEQMARDVLEFLSAQPTSARLGGQGRDEVTVVGDGHTSRFQDRAPGFLSAHFRSSLRALEEALDAPVDERRFRSNISLEGGAPWAEHDLIGQEISISGTTFEVHAPIVRCLAIDADPDNGQRNIPILRSLTRSVGLAQPTFGVLLLPRPGQAGRVIEAGASVEVLTP